MSPTLRERPSNRYLHWLERGGAPPVRGSLPKAEEAARCIVARLRRARRQLEAPASPAGAVNALLEARQHLVGLLALVDSQASVSRRMKPVDAAQWRHRWYVWYDRFCLDLLHRPAGQKLKAIEASTPCARERYQLKVLLKLLDVNPVAEARLQRHATQQKRRDRAYVLDRERHGGVHMLEPADGLHRDYLRQAKRAAEKRGMKGYLYVYGTEEADMALREAHCPEFRRLVGWESNYIPSPTAAIEAMRALRHSIALEDNQPNYATYALGHFSIFPKFERIAKRLNKARSALRKPVQDLENAALAYLNATDHDLEPTPGNRSFAVAQSCGAVYPGDNLFPWRETALKVFSELLSATGWAAYKPARVSGEGQWSTISFHVARHDGQQAHVIYAPFRPHLGEDTYSDGVANAVLGSWSADGSSSTAPVVWIDQGLNPAVAGYDLDDLRVLCHEIGHAIHFISMPGDTPDECATVPVDLAEVPSYLMELYMRDPTVLSRWVSRKSPAAAKRSRYWRRSLMWMEDMAVDHQLVLRSAYVDLQAHLSPQTGFIELNRQALADDGLGMHDEDGSWRRNFVWDDNYACQDYTQTVSRSIVWRLVTVPEHGRTNASLVAQTFCGLLDNVLVKSPTPQAAARRWAQWANEPFSRTLEAGLDAHVAYSARISQRGAKRLRAMTAKRRAKQAKPA